MGWLTDLDGNAKIAVWGKTATFAIVREDVATFVDLEQFLKHPDNGFISTANS